MSDKSDIEWCDATWNPVRGCDKVSAGCKNCYAETFAERWRGIPGHPFEQGFDLRLVPEALTKPLRWRRPRKIFVNSMSDLFHEKIPNEYISAVFGMMAACPQHTFQVLTKRAERLPKWFEWLKSDTKGYWHGEHGRLWKAVESLAPSVGTPANWDAMYRAAHGSVPATRIGDVGAGFRWPLPNVHLGVSCENQETADERIPFLLKTPAALRFISAEPLLGRIGLANLFPSARGMRNDRFWVIVGGESGPGARPMDLAWARSIVGQCKAASIPVFVKQLGARPMAYSLGEVSPLPRLGSRKGGDMSEWPEDLRVRQFPNEVR